VRVRVRVRGCEVQGVVARDGVGEVAVVLLVRVGRRSEFGLGLGSGVRSGIAWWLPLIGVRARVGVRVW
jgi:hypothetical protein